MDDNLGAMERKQSGPSGPFFVLHQAVGACLTTRRQGKLSFAIEVPYLDSIQQNGSWITAMWHGNY